MSYIAFYINLKVNISTQNCLSPEEAFGRNYKVVK